VDGGKQAMVANWILNFIVIDEFVSDEGASDSLKFVPRKVVDNKNCAKLYGDESISAASLCISNTDMQGTCNVSFIIFDATNLSVLNSLVYLMGVLHLKHLQHTIS
jgi:hypothetical protein